MADKVDGRWPVQRVIDLGVCARCGQVHYFCKAHRKHEPDVPCGRGAAVNQLVCIRHGATTPQAKASAKKRGIMARMQGDVGRLLDECGVQVGGRGPAEAMGDALQRAQEMTFALRLWIAELDKPTVKGFGGEEISVLMSEYERWVKLQGLVAKEAHGMGLAERRLELDTEQARVVVTVIQRTLSVLGVSFTDPRVSALVAAELRAIDTTAKEVA